MYDVVYVERERTKVLLAESVPSELAIDVARIESRRRGVGRMFQAGSDSAAAAQVVLIIDRDRQPA